MAEKRNKSGNGNTAEYNRAYYEANREAILAKRKAWRSANSESIRAKAKKYREANADLLKLKREQNVEARKKRSRDYYVANRDALKARSKRWRELNAERVKRVSAEWRKRNPQAKRDWYEANRQRRNKWHWEYQKAKVARDPNFAMYRRVLSMMHRAVKKHLEGKSVSNRARILQLLGCDWIEFVAHVESQFQPGMTWQNHGLSGWHFDHIRPLSAFNLTDETELKIACHYSNVQPLWAADNVRKGAKIA